MKNTKIPVILDIDIGSDIDDTWALAILLESPEPDLKLIVTACGDMHYRARLTVKLLEIARRTDVPI